MFLYRFPRGQGHPVFVHHIRGKNGKNPMFFSLFTGGAPLFLYHIRGKNGKNRIVFFTVFTGGAPLFSLPYPR